MRNYNRDYAIQKAERYRYSDFLKDHSTDDACLEYMWQLRYGDMKVCPKCGKVARYYRIRKRKVYCCASCSHMIAPLAGTIFHKSSTPLTMWFYAIYLFSIAKNGMSAKELERVLGVTYKTALRMLHRIRDLVASENYDNTYFSLPMAQ